jgi:hypothetical protein
MDHATTTAASVCERDGLRILELSSSTGEVVETIDTGWDGTGSFEHRGLDFVAKLLNERELVYEAWIEAGGSQMAMVYQRPPWGPR